MPRPHPKSSALRYPLDFILGTHGSLRALRVLAATQVPLSQSELARRANLSPSAVPALLGSLEAAGVIAYEGRGRTRQVHLHNRHPLISSLRELFRAERDRWVTIQQQLRQILGSNATDIISAWVEGSVTVRRDRFDDALVVGILSEGPLSIATQETLRRASNGVQCTYHVMIALSYYQRADLLRFTATRRAALQNAIVLHGPAPIDLINAQPRARGAQSRERLRVRPNAKDVAARLSDRIVREPEMITDARAHIDRRLPLASSVERLALIEWQGLLDSLTAGQIAALLREDSERADRLRQNSPFLGALGDDDRAELLAPPTPARTRIR